MRKILPLFLFLIVFSSLALAVAPVLQTAAVNEGLRIQYPQFTAHKQNTHYDLSVHVINATDGTIITNETTKCQIHIHNFTGDHIYIANLNYDNDHNEFKTYINKSYLSILGNYEYIIQCNGSAGGSFVSGSFEITESGEETNEAFNFPLIMGIGILIAFCLYFSFGLQPEHFILKLLLIFFALIYAMLIPAVVINGYIAVAPLALKLAMAQFLFFIIYFSVSIFIWWSNKSQYMLKNMDKIRSSFKKR